MPQIQKGRGSKLKNKIIFIETSILPRVSQWGHFWERVLLGVIFVWFGLLKVTGNLSASSIIAKSVYWFDPDIFVPFLGYWEIVMGLALFYHRFLRLAILLLLVRLPGTFLALYYHYNECFLESIFLPTVQGQYLLKEITLVGAALVIAGSIRLEKARSL